LIAGGFVDELGNARPPKTWSELKEMTTALSRFGDSGQIQRAGFVPAASGVSGSSASGNSHLYLYAWLNGASFTDGNGRPSFADPRIEEALTFMTGLYDDLGGFGAVSAFEQTFRFGVGDPFVNGQVSMMIHTTDYLEIISAF